MGAWGAGSFDNDTALEYLDGLADAGEGVGDDDEPGKIALILGPLAMVDSASTDMDDMPEEDDEEGGYLDADLACDAVAAAEVLAANGFKSLAHLTGDMPAWEASGNPVEKSSKAQ